ncbi:hypothetical protein NHX12_027524 [Muraenolepis orangiensis]|uniref:Transposase n=1 Tax=Muraenolepis orangiensis TaxID=630683 RepID=A0A9Q0EH44_9TELE|nr:hypothetical protein NHX12_027524 [Muraenolepis orangiensis]
MSPVAKALNILQGEIDVQMGWRLPTLNLLISKLDRIRNSSRYCKPLVDALQDGLQRRFGDMLTEPEFIAAAIFVPKFKTSWTKDENTLKLGNGLPAFSRCPGKPLPFSSFPGVITVIQAAVSVRRYSP